MAIFHETINGNPATAVPSVPVPRSKKKPVPVKDLDAVRAAIREWASAENGQITSRGKRVDYGMTHAAIRPIALPDWAAALLRQRKVGQTPNDLDAVFITRNGTWRFTTNVQCRLSHIRLRDDDADLAALEDVSPHSFRRTVATEIDEVYDAEAAMNQLASLGPP